MDAIRDSNALRPRIALLTARIEDRLPEQQEDVDELLAHLDAMDPATLPLGERRTALLASGLLRFSVLVLGQRMQAATELLADLAVTDAFDKALRKVRQIHNKRIDKSRRAGNSAVS